VCQLEIKVLYIINARCNHEVYSDMTFKNFKLSDFLKFSDFNEALTNSLMIVY